MEAQSGAAEVAFDEEQTCTQKQVIDIFYDLIGPYKVYSDTHKGLDYESELVMKQTVIDKFWKYRQTLAESLACEDFEEQGILDLTQLKEAILSVEDDLDNHILDYMLFYVYVRNESGDRFEYKSLLTMLEEQGNKRVQSAKPASNQVAKTQAIISSESDDKYSDIEQES